MECPKLLLNFWLLFLLTNILLMHMICKLKNLTINLTYWQVTNLIICRFQYIYGSFNYDSLENNMKDIEI